MTNTNKIEKMIDEKAKKAALKAANNFNQTMLLLFDVKHHHHYISEIAENLPDGFNEEHVKIVITAMKKVIEEEAYKKEQDVLLLNLREALDFMRHVEND
uniref:hypothetical protein n=1 Tax=Ningiella ruwaisensis TaxID=2364274 RepID=UPI0010A031C3|nr:hypothetical protein [Ningiella ruwaisensis]